MNCCPSAIEASAPTCTHTSLATHLTDFAAPFPHYSSLLHDRGRS